MSEHYYHSRDLPRFAEIGKDAPESFGCTAGAGSSCGGVTA